MKQITNLGQITNLTEVHYRTAEFMFANAEAFFKHDLLTDTYQLSVIDPETYNSMVGPWMGTVEMNMLLRTQDLKFFEKLIAQEYERLSQEANKKPTVATLYRVFTSINKDILEQGDDMSVVELTDTGFYVDQIYALHEDVITWEEAEQLAKELAEYAKAVKEVIEYFNAYGVKIESFDLQEFADAVHLSVDKATTALCNMELQEAMQEVADGNYDNFDLTNENLFNDSWSDMIQSMLSE